jgi:hypothetical protein
VIAPGCGVEIAAGILDRSGQEALRVALSTLQQHVFEEMRDAGVLRGLVGRTGPDPQVQGHNRRDVHLLHEEGRPVRKDLTSDHGVFR